MSTGDESGQHPQYRAYYDAGSRTWVQILQTPFPPRDLPFQNPASQLQSPELLLHHHTPNHEDGHISTSRQPTSHLHSLQNHYPNQESPTTLRNRSASVADQLNRYGAAGAGVHQEPVGAERIWADVAQRKRKQSTSGGVGVQMQESATGAHAAPAMSALSPSGARAAQTATGTLHHTPGRSHSISDPGNRDGYFTGSYVRAPSLAHSQAASEPGQTSAGYHPSPPSITSTHSSPPSINLSPHFSAKGAHTASPGSFHGTPASQATRSPTSPVSATSSSAGNFNSPKPPARLAEGSGMPALDLFTVQMDGVKREKQRRLKEKEEMEARAAREQEMRREERRRGHTRPPGKHSGEHGHGAQPRVQHGSNDKIPKRPRAGSARKRDPLASDDSDSDGSLSKPPGQQNAGSQRSPPPVPTTSARSMSEDDVNVDRPRTNTIGSPTSTTLPPMIAQRSATDSAVYSEQPRAECTYGRTDSTRPLSLGTRVGPYANTSDHARSGASSSTVNESTYTVVLERTQDRKASDPIANVPPSNDFLSSPQIPSSNPSPPLGSRSREIFDSPSSVSVLIPIQEADEPFSSSVFSAVPTYDSSMQQRGVDVSPGVSSSLSAGSVGRRNDRNPSVSNVSYGQTLPGIHGPSRAETTSPYDVTGASSKEGSSRPASSEHKTSDWLLTQRLSTQSSASCSSRGSFIGSESSVLERDLRAIDEQIEELMSRRGAIYHELERRRLSSSSNKSLSRRPLPPTPASPSAGSSAQAAVTPSVVPSTSPVVARASSVESMSKPSISHLQSPQHSSPSAMVPLTPAKVFDMSTDSRQPHPQPSPSPHQAARRGHTPSNASSSPPVSSLIFFGHGVQIPEDTHASHDEQYSTPLRSSLHSATHGETENSAASATAASSTVTSSVAAANVQPPLHRSPLILQVSDNTPPPSTSTAAPRGGIGPRDTRRESEGEDEAIDRMLWELHM